MTDSIADYFNSRLFDEVAERYSSEAQSCGSSGFKFEKRNH